MPPSRTPLHANAPLAASGTGGRFSPGLLGLEGVCWSRRAYRVQQTLVCAQRGEGPESRSRWSVCSRRQTHTWRLGVVVTEDDPYSSGNYFTRSQIAVPTICLFKNGLTNGAVLSVRRLFFTST